MRLSFLAASLIAAAATALPSARAQNPFDAPQRSVLASPVVTVPLIRDGGFYYADVLMNGRPFRFTLETGAGFFGISNRAAAVLGVRIDTVAIPQGPRAPVVRIDSVSIGGVSFYGLAARVSSTFDNSGIDGIISVSLLRDLLATLDLGKAQLRLERGSLPPVNDRDVVEIAGLDRGGRVDVWMNFAGVRTPAVLDTRSFLWIIFPDSLESRLRLDSPPRAMGEARGPSLGVFQLRGARLTGDASIGGNVLPRPELVLRNRPGTVLGVPILEQYEVTIDQRNGRVRFSRPGGMPVVVPAMSLESRPTSGTPSEPQRRATGGTPPALASGQRTIGFNMAGAPGSAQLRIVNLVPGSNAEKEGVKNGDTVVEFDGKPIAELNRSFFQAAVERGGAVKVIIQRDGKSLTFNIVPHLAP